MRNKTFPENIKKQGWERMNELLNKELPRRRNRKRILVFFLIFGIISTFGLFIMKNYNNAEVSIGVLKSGKNEIQKVTSDQKHTGENIVRIANERSGNKNILHNKTNIANLKSKPDKNTLKENNKSRPETNTIEFQTKADENLNIPEIAFNKKSENVKLSEEDFSHLFTLKTPKFTEQNEPLLQNFVMKIPEKSFNRYFNPYIEMRVFNTTLERIAPKLEFSAGNTFYFNRRFFLDIGIGFTNSRLLVSSVNLASDDPDSKSTANEIELYNNQDVNEWSIKHGVFELSLHEGYRISRKIALKAGGGISFTKGINSVLSENTGKLISNENGIEINDSEFGSISLLPGYLIPDQIYFADLNVQYQIINKVNMEIGYKYYFNNYYVLTDTQLANVYRAYIKQPPVISNFYLGLKYNFRK